MKPHQSDLMCSQVLPSIVVFTCFINADSLVAQMVKNMPAMWETGVQYVGWEDPLEEGMATHSSILAWIIPMDTGAWWAAVHGVAQNQT